MRKLKMMTILLCLTAVPLWSQTKSTPPKKQPAQAPAARSAADVSARIETTAGKLTCKLFPDKAPIGVQNFIDLAEGKKDWTSPITHQKKHGVPLYDGTIFTGRKGRSFGSRPIRAICFTSTTVASSHCPKIV